MLAGFAVVLGLLAAVAFPTAPPTARGQQPVEVVASGLDTPWALAFALDGRLFLTERPGRIRVVKQLT